MKLSGGKDSPGEIAASFRAASSIYGGLGSPLYSSFCTKAADDPDMIALARHAIDGARPIHVFTAVHHLLLGNPNDPLSRYYATLADDPAPPEEAYPVFTRYCAEHRDEILELLRTRTVQMTYVERCRPLIAPLALVAEQAGEPLNLIEIGCAAGVLLAFDKYAYDLDDRGRVGSADAPVTLKGDLRGKPALRIPKIGSRTGLDLHVVDVNSEEQRRWVLASTYPETREQQKRLAKAMDVVANTDIRMMEGDAVELLPGVLAATPDPVCVYHSACLMYWSAESKDVLDNILKNASRTRDIYRVSLEPTEHFDTWSAGRGDKSAEPATTPQFPGEAIITRYSGGTSEKRLVGRHSMDYGTIEWLAS